MSSKKTVKKPVGQLLLYRLCLNNDGVGGNDIMTDFVFNNAVTVAWNSVQLSVTLPVSLERMSTFCSPQCDKLSRTNSGFSVLQKRAGIFIPLDIML